MQSRASTVAEYLSELPPDRRKVIAAVRKVIRKSVDKDIEEGMQYGMIGYYIPHRVFPAGYHCDPEQGVPYLALASQKNYMALYLMFAYVGTAAGTYIREAYAKAGRKLDMGKCCLRFKSLEELDLDVVAEAIRRAPSKSHLKVYEAQTSPEARKKRSAARKAARA